MTGVYAEACDRPAVSDAERAGVGRRRARPGSCPLSALPDIRSREHARFGKGFVGGDRDGGFLFAFGKDLEEQLGAAAVEFHVAELVNTEKIDPAVTGDRLCQDLLVGSLDELVDEFGGQHVTDTEVGHGGLGAQGHE